MSKTALQYLAEEVKETTWLPDESKTVLKAYIEMLYAKERIQIQKAFDEGAKRQFENESGEEYYKHTFKTKTDATLS